MEKYRRVYDRTDVDYFCNEDDGHYYSSNSMFTRCFCGKELFKNIRTGYIEIYQDLNQFPEEDDVYEFSY